MPYFQTVNHALDVHQNRTRPHDTNLHSQSQSCDRTSSIPCPFPLATTSKSRLAGNCTTKAPERKEEPLVMHTWTSRYAHTVCDFSPILQPRGLISLSFLNVSPWRSEQRRRSRGWNGSGSPCVLSTWCPHPDWGHWEGVCWSGTLTAPAAPPWWTWRGQRR